MSIDNAVTAPQDQIATAPAEATELSGVEELLVEEVSIDGMCGVY
jgi:mycofactocin precursor